MSHYGEVIAALIDGDPVLSVRGEVAEQCWRIVTPTLEAFRENRVPLDEYPAGPLDPTRFYPRFGPLPAVIEVREQSGEWNTVCRTRTLMLSDGGHVIETITDTDSPALFAYELSEFQKLFGILVSGARAEWRCEPCQSSSIIRWSYTFLRAQLAVGLFG